MTALRFEIIPADGIEQRLVRAFPEPTGVTITVTSLPQHGVERTIRTSAALADQGFRVVPHLAAHAIADRRALQSLVQRMLAAGITETFAVSGDGPAHQGYATSLHLIRDLADLDPTLSIGIAGYPEGHPAMTDEHLMQHLVDRLPFVDKIITQMCFSADVVGEYALRLRAAGVDAPLWAGVAGPIKRTRLLSLSARIGVGASISFVRRSTAVAGDLLRGRDYDPAPFVTALLAEPGLGEAGLAGLHVYSFNEVERLGEFSGFLG